MLPFSLPESPFNCAYSLVLASGLRFLQLQGMAAYQQYAVVRANSSSPCCVASGVSSCKKKAVARVMPVLSNSPKALQLRKTSLFSSRPRALTSQWRIARRIFLKCSVESSVQVIIEGNVDALSKMRELVDLAGGKSEGIDDATLMRFLKGFSLNIDEAAKAFANHQEWEISFKPKGFISETEIPNELNAKKSYLQGKDKQGRPLSVILARNHFLNNDFDEYRRFIVYSMDRVIKAASTAGTFSAIIDLKGLGFKNLDSRALINGFDIYQSHYPERIEKFYMVNAPLIFNGLWKVVSPFINANTRKKIVFVQNKKVQETLLREFDADQLPVEYGGTAKLVPLQDAIVSGWPPVEQDPSSQG